MPKNIFSSLSREGKIFKDERYLYPEFVPERLPFRDAEIDSIAYAFQPVTKGGKPQNLFLTGMPGTGKTVCAKFVLRQLEEYSDRAKLHYINCFEFGTRASALASIANFLGSPIPRRGLATDEIYSKILDQFKAVQFVPIIILDEFDQMTKGDDGQKLLYDLLRVTEFQKNRFGLIIISNDKTLVANLDNRIRSSLSETTIEFQQYSPQQLKEILKERSEYAFAANALGKDVVNVAAAHASKLSGDARVAIESLLKAGRFAEQQHSQTVELPHLYKAFESIDNSTAMKTLKNLSSDEKSLLKIISEKGPLNSGELYKEFNSQAKSPLGERRIRELISGLEDAKLVHSELIDLGNKGKTKKLSLACGKEALLEVLKGNP